MAAILYNRATNARRIFHECVFSQRIKISGSELLLKAGTICFILFYILLEHSRLERIVQCKDGVNLHTLRPSSAQSGQFPSLWKTSFCNASPHGKAGSQEVQGDPCPGE